MCFSKQPQGPEKKDKANYLQYFPLAGRESTAAGMGEQTPAGPRAAPRQHLGVQGGCTADTLGNGVRGHRELVLSVPELESGACR